MNCSKCGKRVTALIALIAHEKNCDGAGSSLDKKLAKRNLNWKCPVCNKVIKNHRQSHVKSCNGMGPKRLYTRLPGGKAWARGLTKETNEIIAKTARVFSENVKSGKTIPKTRGVPLKSQHRKAISQGMKKAHQEGRANDWQDSKRFDGKSYPEIFFEKLLNNNHISFEYNKKIGKYHADFAFLHKKIILEIDGSQHQKTVEYDKKRDEYLKSQGWKVYRYSWSDLFENTKVKLSQILSIVE